MKKLLISTLKVIVFFIGWALFSGIGDIPSENPALWRLGAEALPLVYIIVFSIIFWLIEKRKIKIISFNKPVLNVGIGIGVGTVWIGIAVGIVRLLGALTFSDTKNKIEHSGIWFLACFLNVVMQELLFRGYLYQLIKKNYNAIAAIIVTAILFTAMHGGAFEAGAIAVLNVITMSVFVSLVLEYTGSLVAPILIHAVWNSIGSIILGVVSLADDYPHLLNAVFSGNVLITGGSCKIEGSIVVLALNVTFSAIFLFLLKKKKFAQHSFDDKEVNGNSIRSD